MKKKSVPLIFLFAFPFFMQLSCGAQDSVSVSFKRVLTVSDFKAVPDQSVRWLAFSWIGLRFNYTKPQPCEAGRVKYEFTVTPEFDDSRSWFKTAKLSKKQTADVLAHEQEHFNIGEIMANEIYVRLRSLCFNPERAKTEIDSIVRSMHEQYTVLQQQYDAGIYNGGNIEKNQETWSAKIHQLLIDSRKRQSIAQNPK